MFLKLPQNSQRVFWTGHSKKKMRQYQLSEKRVLGILRKPDRKEEGVAPGTIAHMQITGTKKHPTEAWMMYQIKKSKTESRISGTRGKKRTSFSSPIKNQKAKIIKVISAWRYPGRTPEGQRPIIPEDILQDLLKEGIKV